MKLLYFDDWHLGVLKGQSVVDITPVVATIAHADRRDLMAALIGQFDVFKSAIEDTVAKVPGVPVTTVRIRQPLPRPRQIACMAVNYMENGTLAVPAPINAFHKSPSCIIGPGEAMVLPDVPASVFEGEAELALVIGRRCSHIGIDKAMNYVFGYLNFIDGSARGLLPSNNTFYQMKSRDTFAPIGPYIVTADEVPNPQNLQVRLWVNGALKQDFNTDDMAQPIPRCIEWLSTIHTLEPGDIVATGTNHRGLSAFHDGDLIELEVDGLGRLRFGVRDDLKRTWSRETRLEAMEREFAATGKKQRPTGVLAKQLTGKYSDVKHAE